MYGTLISAVTVGAGGATSINFTSIPQTPYTDLLLVLSGRSGDTGGGSFGVSLVLNSDSTATNYNLRRMYGNGSSSNSLSQNTNLVITQNLPGATSSTFGNALITIPNYALATNKTYSVESVTENNGTEAYQQILSGVWSNTAAITSISLTAVNFAQYSTAYLYGLTKGSGGATVS